MKHSSLSKVIFLFLMTMAASTPTIAGEIVLHNGDIFHGELKTINEETIVWMSETLGELRLSKEKVERFASSTILHTVKSDANNAGNCSLKMSETIDGICEKGQISGLQLEELVATSPPAPLAPFSGEATFNTNRKSGNSSSSDSNFKARLKWNQEEFRHEADLAVELDKDDGNTTEENYEVDYQLNYDFNDRWFSYGRVDYDKDRFSAVDEQYEIGVGLGRRVYLENQLSLNLQLGPSYLITKNPGVDTEKDLAGRWALRLDWPISYKDITLFHEHSQLWLIEDTNNNWLKSSTGIKIPLFAGIFSEMRYDFDYVAEPGDGNKHADDEWVISVGYMW
jgi:putative salt-induced outer membrane protein YdiY